MTPGTEMTPLTSRRLARRSDASLPVAARTPRSPAASARFTRSRGVVGVFAALAVLGFGVAYIGPTGFALSKAQAATIPVTLYADTVADVQHLDAAPDAANQPVTLDRGSYTVYVTPKPTPTPTPTKKPTTSSSSSRSSSWSVPFVSPDPGSAQAIAYDMVHARGWGDDQFSCLVALWNRESGWRVNAYNAGSGAYGIPQSLPGSKMASAGADWETNPATQISWGLGYIGGRYGTPCGAWGHSQSTGWY